MTEEILSKLERAIQADDVTGATALLAANGQLSELLETGGGCSGGRHLAAVRSARMADLILEHGVTTAMISGWWAPGFGLEMFSPVVAEHLIGRGAALTAHAAAALGLVDRLRAMLDRQPELVHAKGGDGARPLHFSRNVEVARLLVERGAELDPRDDDHDSTPAQWRIGNAPDVTRFLVERGARTDIFMAAALNDPELAAKRVHEDPECTAYRIGNNCGPFPGIGFHGRGGTIYQWTLGFNQSPQEIAFHRGHRAMFEFLMNHTRPRQQLLVACMLADRERAKQIVARHPDLVGEFDDEDRALVAKSCWETNLNREAVRLMLDLGFPVDEPEFSHGYRPLHNAAWCGDAELVKLLLERGHPIDQRDPTYRSTALGFALHSCLVARRHPEGDFPRVVGLLLDAGTPLDEGRYPTGNSGIDKVIEDRKRKAT